MFSWFEKKIDPFPTEAVSTPPTSFFPFVWHVAKGIRGCILAMGLLAAVLGVFEAILFAILGKIVDWLNIVEPASFWAEEGHKLILLACVILSRIILVAIQTMLKYQTLAGNLRWQFRRTLLNQSISFFADEFAGRIATKVMQTVLAVRDFYMIVVDILIFATIYFITITVTVGYFDLFLLLPFSL